MSKRMHDYQEAANHSASYTLLDAVEDAEAKENEKKGVGAAPVTVDPLKFMLAGKARFTIVSKRTGDRYTYRIKSSDSKWKPDEKHPRIWWVSLLTGPDNSNDFTYMATIFDGGDMRLTGKSRYTSATKPWLAIKFVYEYLLKHGKMHPEVELHHEGRCGRCGRVLTVPESITSGFGPECRGLMGL